MGARRDWKGADPAKLEAFVRDSGLSYKTTSKSYVFTCPLCRKPDKLYVRKYDGKFVCWVCAETSAFKGAPEYAFVELTSLPLRDIRAALYGDLSVNLGGSLNVHFNDFMEDDEDEVEVEDVLQAITEPWYHYPIDHAASEPGAVYLAERGIPLAVAAEYNIRYSTEERTVIFPVEMGDILVGWQGRTIDPVEEWVLGKKIERLKVRSTKDLPRERVVMFANRLTTEHAVLCEGPVDAIKAHLVGGNVATMGKTVNEGQVKLLLRSGIRKLYLAVDPDAAYDMDSLLAKFGSIPCHQVEIPRPYSDLGDMPLDEAKETILTAKPLLMNRMHLYFRGQE